jgi:cytochrome P450
MTACMPLSLGPYVCLGKALSTIILTTMLARILRESCVSLPPDQSHVKPLVGIVVSPRRDLRLVVIRLDTAGQRRES